MNPAPAHDDVLTTLRSIEQNIRSGKLDEATAALARLEAAFAADVRTPLAAAMLARAQGDSAAEIDALWRALALAPQAAGVHAALATALSRSGSHADAVMHANSAVTCAPDDMATLEIAVAVADAAGDLPSAQRHLESALALRPGSLPVLRALARCLAKQGRNAAAEKHWRAILAARPDDLFALRWLGACLIALDRKQEACAVLERADSLSPDDAGVQFHLAIARGQTPRGAPAPMMQELFDGYANQFDAELVGRLQYQVPRLVADIILERHPARDVSVLDLGCGTGLLGAYLGPVLQKFVGVDVSGRMIDLARRHGAYTQLQRGDLLAILQETPPDTFDYVIANDVFIYVGDVSEVIPACFRVLRTGGALIFSCETADDSEGEMVIRPTQRFAHSRKAIQSLCSTAGFTSCVLQDLALRLENKIPIAGFLAIAEKSAT